MSLKKDPVYISFISYVESLEIPYGLKDFILDERFIKENPLFYLKYPYLFASAFNIKDKELLNKLSIAGFLYYKSIILMDKIYDSSNKDFLSNPYFFIGISTCQEESIKILSDFFGLESSFWNLWNQRKAEYLKAIAIERKTPIDAQFKFSQYRELADFKSAFGKVAIDSLF